jgi:hypothetical protein
MSKADQGPQNAKNDRARELLIRELEEVVGEDTISRADIDVDRAIAPRSRSLRAAFVSSRLLILVVGAALLVAGVIASLATESWIWFGVAIFAHALLSLVVIGSAFAQTTQVEKPAPTTVTALEAEGVADPEGALNDLVEQVADAGQGSRVKRAVTDDAAGANADGDRAAAALDQQGATTPASDPTRPPGSG